MKKITTSNTPLYQNTYLQKYNQKLIKPSNTIKKHKFTNQIQEKNKLVNQIQQKNNIIATLSTRNVYKNNLNIIK